MRVAALVVTNRPHFLPWWTRQISKQTRKPDEVIVVTNARYGEAYFQGLHELTEVADTLVYHQPPEPWVSLGYLRQKALDLTRADALAWFDDDDWYHPRRLELSVAPIEANLADAAVFPLTHFYYIHSDRLLPFPRGTGFHLPSTMWRTELAKRARFFHLGTAEDTHWLNRLVQCEWADPIVPPQRVYWETRYTDPHIGGIVTVHGRNTWQNSDPRGDFQQHELLVAEHLPKHPPAGESREDWQGVRDFFARVVADERFSPAWRPPRKPYKPSSKETWLRAHRSNQPA